MPGTAATAILLVVIVILYLIPSIVAYGRDHPYRERVAVVNILFGWTLIGWILVFLWAALRTPAVDEAA